MAQRVGLSNESISRIWRTFGLQPHRTESFQLSTDPLFVDKVRDVVGLYVSPPQNALVLCVDEKSQIQALERTQPVLPLIPGQPERHTSDYFRHGTLSLFAALDIATGRIYARCQKRHRQQEFLRFLKQVETEVPPLREIHMVLGPGQLRRPQNPVGSPLDRAASALASAFHPHPQQLAQPSGAFLCQDHCATDTSGKLSERPSPAGNHSELYRTSQPKSRAFQVDRFG